VGTLTRATDGAIAFTYDPAWLASEAAFPVASALPLTKLKWQGDPVVAAFDNLLPDDEGELREKIAARVGAQGKDVFSLLSVLGRDCVGALQFLPVDEAPAEQDMQYRIISEEEMVADLKNLAAAPLALGEDEGRAAGLPKGSALEQLRDMVDRLGPALERALLAVGDQVPAAVSEPITSDAMLRAAQMRDLLSPI
tara:strand:- start:9053 stop:9640 length:588 start_codon:yes stop_codon:yes gene_type:complete